MSLTARLSISARELIHRSRLPVYRRLRWAIAIYTGSSPLDLQPADGGPCPVLTADDVTDVEAGFVADPFMLHDGSTWCMFFEVWNHRAHRGSVGLAESSDGLHWTYRRIVLDEPFHLSYPHVFEWNGGFYMIPESHQAEVVRLYQATDWPTRWEPRADLLDGCFVDSSVWQFNDSWWMLAFDKRCEVLRLFRADGPAGPWLEHPKSPLAADGLRFGRPGGRVVVWGGRLIRFAQDTRFYYGNAVHALEITRLTDADYQEEEMQEEPVIGCSGHGWNARGMHHIDCHRVGGRQWMACVDGCRRTVHLGNPEGRR